MSADDAGWDDFRAISTTRNLIPETSKTSLNANGNLSSPYDNIWMQGQYSSHEYADTAVAETAYDRVFAGVTNAAKKWRDDVSDHIPVYGVFFTNKADDD